MNRHFYQKTQLILLQLKSSAKHLINFLVICPHRSLVVLPQMQFLKAVSEFFDLKPKGHQKALNATVEHSQKLDIKKIS